MFSTHASSAGCFCGPSSTFCPRASSGRYCRWSPRHVSRSVLPATDSSAVRSESAVLGALILSRLHNQFSDYVIVVASGAVYALALALLVMVPSTVAAVLLLLPAGAGWMVALSVGNSRLELVLPAWIRARGLSVFQMFLFGAQAVGAVLWGAIGDVFGVVPAFLIAALFPLVGVATFRLCPFFDVSQIDPSTAPIWAEPELAIDPQPNVGPVAIGTVYTIASANEEAFLALMQRLRRPRQRLVGQRWGLVEAA